MSSFSSHAEFTLEYKLISAFLTPSMTKYTVRLRLHEQEVPGKS